MSCHMPLCQHIRVDGARIALDHSKNTIPGHTFYYCCIHRVYHCIQQKSYCHRRRLQQPLCGECAWLFFRFDNEAEKRPTYDIPDTSTARDSPRREGGAPIAHRRVSAESSDDDSDSLPVSETALEDALEDINGSVSYSRRPSPTPTRIGLPGSSTASEYTSRHAPSSGGSSDCDSVVVAAAAASRRDREGDIVMGDGSRGPSPDAEPVQAPGPGADADAPRTVGVPIRDRNSVLGSIPYDGGGALLSVTALDFHAKFPEVFMFRYTDFAGRSAVQPTAGRDHTRSYFAPLKEARCDDLLRRARCWCCWAQGFEHLEPEVRWVLTLVYDFANVMIARQALGGYGAESPVFWRSRHHLHYLLSVAEDLADLFGITNLDVPRMEWFSVVC